MIQQKVVSDMNDSCVSNAASMAATIRRDALRMALSSGNLGAHIAPALSCAEIFGVLYSCVLRYDVERPAMPERDRFLISKAHCVLALYSALSQIGLIGREMLDTFEKNGSPLAGHPTANIDMGIEYSGGSLGQAMSVAVGMALDAKQSGRSHRVFVLLGDGELNEGANWEAFMSASHFGLADLTAIVDKNRLQYDGPTEEIMALGDLESKFRSFGWDVVTVDGHDVAALADALSRRDSTAPYVVIADTIKGKGVSFMEGVREWHHSRITLEQYEAAMAELDCEAIR